MRGGILEDEGGVGGRASDKICVKLKMDTKKTEENLIPVLDFKIRNSAIRVEEKFEIEPFRN